MIKLHEFMSGDGLQHLLRINLERVAYVTEDAGPIRLHFSALPGDFVDVIDFHGHLRGDD
jgi:hypothetical protein